MLGLSEELLKSRNGYWTAKEILQQPRTLRDTEELLRRERSALEAFLTPLLERSDLRLILSGAGSSAFIGECLSHWLQPRLAARVEAIATTDITCAPHKILRRSTPTLLISFARSGDSPESVAAVDAVERVVDESHHLAITCNIDGALARRMASVKSGTTLSLPPVTNDRGFAMTSSFTAMAFAARAMLGGMEEAFRTSELVRSGIAALLEQTNAEAVRLAGEGYDRVVFLGSHLFTGAAREAALKLLELSDGQTVAIHDTPMGFRHGPKTFVTDRTLVVLFLSSDPRIRRYDLDLARELANDGRAGEVIIVGGGGELPNARFLHVPGLEAAVDIDLLIPYIVFAQMITLHTSLARGMEPDNPNRSGTVNRVVAGVTIHEIA